MRILITILACLILAVSASGVDRPVEEVPLTEVAQPTLAPVGVCVFGNDAILTFAIGDWMQGNESYAILFDADRPECGCAAGFQVEAVHMHINFGPEDVPVFLEASASFMETTLNESTGCMQPGAEIYRSPVRSFNIVNPGLYDISVPVDLESCPCAKFGFEYAVGMNILTRFESFPDVVTGRTAPMSCSSYTTAPGYWYDLSRYGLADPKIFADIVCCSPAVPDDDRSWGSLKSLYR
ncbi:MAG: hypothetical protein GY838_11660 [bacterium]|nr:hypothetical protein [bacterium]